MQNIIKPRALYEETNQHPYETFKIFMASIKPRSKYKYQILTSHDLECLDSEYFVFQGIK